MLQGASAVIILGGRYLNSEDSAFVEKIQTDIQDYINQDSEEALVFPPLDNYHRYLIHLCVSEDFPGYRSVSIGEAEERRTAVCKASLTAAPQAPPMDHNVGMGRKNFGRGQSRMRPSPDRRHPGERGGSAERRASSEQGSDRWGGRGARQWSDNRNKQRGRWEHDDRVGPEYKSQNVNSPGMGRRGRGRGRGMDASPQFPRKNNADNRGHNPNEWGPGPGASGGGGAGAGGGGGGGGGQKGGPRLHRDSEGGSWGSSGPHSGQVSPQVYRRSSDPWGDSRRHGSGRGALGQEPDRPGGALNRNMPEGAELDRGKARRPDAQVYVPRARRQQMEETDDMDPPMNTDLPPQGSMGRPVSARRGTTTNDVYVPRVRRAEQDINRNQPMTGAPSSRPPGGQRYGQAQRGQENYHQENWDNEVDNRKQQRRRKSMDGQSRSGSRSGSLDSRNRFNDDAYHNDSNRSQERIAEQTYYNRGMRAVTPDDFLDAPGGNYKQQNPAERPERPPSRTRRRRRSHSNSSRRSQPSPSRGGVPAHTKRDGRRGSDAWSQDDQYQSRNRRLSDAWSQDEYYPSGSNSLPRRQRRRSGGYNNPDDWSPGIYATEPLWSPVHQMNEPWGPNDSRTLGRIRRSSGPRSYDDSRLAPGSPAVEQTKYNFQANQQQQHSDSWTQQKPGRGRGRTRRSSGGDEKYNTHQGQRVRKTSGNWDQDQQTTPQTGKRWLRSPAQSRRKNKQHPRSATPSESWSSDAENWDNESMTVGPSQQGGGRFPPTENIIIEVTAGGRNVTDIKGRAVTPMDHHQCFGSPQHSTFLEESVRAQANDLSSKVSSMCADLSELKHAKEMSNSEIRSPKHDDSSSSSFSHPRWPNKKDKDPELDNRSFVGDSTSSSTSPSHGSSNDRPLRPAPTHHHPIDMDDVSSDGQSSVQPESSTSPDSPDTGDSRALSSGGEQDATPESWSPGPVEYSTTEKGKEVLLLVAEGVRQVAQPAVDTTGADPQPQQESVALEAQADVDNNQGSVDIGEITVEIEKDSPENDSGIVTTGDNADRESSPVQDAGSPMESHQDAVEPAACELPGEDVRNEEAGTEVGDCVEAHYLPEVDHGESVEGREEPMIEAAAEPQPQVVPATGPEELPEAESEESHKADTEVVSKVEPEGKPESEPEAESAKDSEVQEFEKEEDTGAENETVETEGVTGEGQEDEETPVAHMNWADMIDDDDDGGDSWDCLFDETGEALDPKLLDELTIAVGKEVKVKKPQFDYYNYEPKDPEMAGYDHLLEICDFSKELVTRDLLMAFKDYHDRGFDIKWVDDTHAIAVFSGAIAAKSALGMRHPLLKVRPMSLASRQTKTKAKRCAEFLEPYRPRPETTAAVARNLVTGALGLKSRVPREKRDAERSKIREARDKKRNAQKQKKDAWEGNFGRCAMDQK